MKTVRKASVESVSPASVTCYSWPMRFLIRSAGEPASEMFCRTSGKGTRSLHCPNTAKETRQDHLLITTTYRMSIVVDRKIMESKMSLSVPVSQNKVIKGLFLWFRRSARIRFRIVTVTVTVIHLLLAVLFNGGSTCSVLVFFFFFFLYRSHV